jgi:chloramphenicol-sensitive protein RarD
VSGLPRDDRGTLPRAGLLAGLGAYLIWGLLPLYLKLLTGIEAGEVLAQRITWSVVIVAALVLATGGAARLRAALRQPRLMLLLFASAVCIAINWLVYTWSILNAHAIDTSLGYFINPLISVMFGVVLLGERLVPLQWAAVGCAVAGVLVTTIAHGEVPLISLALAFSFATYGLIRKQAAVDAITGLFVETLVLLPVALFWLLTRPPGAGFERPLPVLALLSAGGVLTAVPLILFGYAARRLPLSTIGLMQYIAPSMVLLQAVFLFGEPMDTAKLIAFSLIWLGLGLYTISLARRPAPVVAPLD